MTKFRAARAAGIVPLAAVALLILAACNNSPASAGAGPSTAGTSSSQRPAGQNGQNPGAGRPGASGMIAEVDTDSMQVQSDDSQTTVGWTAGTTFARTVKGTLTDVRVGSCIVAVTGRADGAAAGEPLAAGTVTITAPVDGECGAGFGRGSAGFGAGGGAGNRPSGPPSAGQSGAPTRPSGGGFPGGGAGFGQIVAGKVTAVSGSSITVEAARPRTTETAPSTGATTTQKVQVSGSTNYTTEQRSTSAAVKTGLCATVIGAADNIGAIAATSVTLTDPVDGRCTSIRGGFGARGGSGNGAGRGSTGPTTNG